MVSSWLPDPPLGRSSDDISPISVPAAFIDSDTDDQESNIEGENSLENGGYLPLNDNDNPLDDDSEDTEDETSDVTSQSAQSIPDSSDLDNTAFGTSVSIPVLDHNNIQETAEPRDIDVDCEQVRAIMARVTLPASATPSWASTIPDSEWCTFLQDRIRTLQGRSELLSESKN